MDEGGNRAVGADHERRAAVTLRRKWHGASIGIDVAVPVGKPEAQLERRIAECLGERVLALSGGGLRVDLDH